MSAPAQLGPPLDGDVTVAPMLLSVTVVTTILALAVVVLRMFVRLTIIRVVGWDDWTIIAAAACAIGVMVLEILGIEQGLGRHAYYLTHERITSASMYSQIAIVPNLIASMLARVSFCLFMLRIVELIRSYRIFFWIIILVTIGSTSACIVQMLIQCDPIAKLWDTSLDGTCRSSSMRSILGWVQAISAITCDILVALFPILILKQLKMALKTKIATALLMGLGVIIGVVCVVKTMFLKSLTHRPDLTFDTMNLTILSIVEQNVSIIVVCVPAIRPLFARFFGISSYQGSDKPVNIYDIEFNYDLNNISDPTKVHSEPTTVTTASVRRSQEDRDKSNPALPWEATSASGSRQLPPT